MGVPAGSEYTTNNISLVKDKPVKRGASVHHFFIHTCVYYNHGLKIALSGRCLSRLWDYRSRAFGSSNPGSAASH
jgi:hypothetical protein